MKEYVLPAEDSLEDSVDEGGDPQLPDEGDDVNPVQEVSSINEGSKVIVSITPVGGVAVEIIGEWKGKQIRAIPGAVMKGFRQRRLKLYKETQTNL